MLWSRKNDNIILSLLLFVFTIMIFGPVEIYFTNSNEFWFSKTDIFIISSILVILCILFHFVIIVLLKKEFRGFYSAILFALGIALYIQGNYINIDYGVLDGTAIDWNSYSVYAVLDTLGWITLILAIVFLYLHQNKLFCKIQKYVSLFVIAVEAITLGILFLTSNATPREQSEYYLSNTGIYDISANENIIIFVLDAFDEVYLQEILQNEPEKYAEIFTDFTHFKNASVGASRTKFAMPAIITGEHYPGEISYPEYIQQAFDNDKLYTTLKKRNYDIRFYTKSVFIPDASDSLVDNQISTGYVVSSYPGLVKKYFSLTLYKYLPHVLKKHFWIYTGDFEQYKSGSSEEAYIIDDEIYFNGLNTDGLQINQNKNIFRLIHLNGAHSPYNINEYGKKDESGETSLIQQAKGSLYVISTYISQLKNLGLYDATNIIIMADHGDIDLGAHGILLVKERNQKMPFNESNAPVSYYDLHATIFKHLETEKGPTFFEISENSSRERYFYPNFSESGKIRTVEYIINNDITEGDIQETGVVFEQVLTGNRQYLYGTLLKFGGNNTALEYIVNGISGGEEGAFSWTDEKKCEFEFELEKRPKKDILVTLDVMAVNDSRGPQKVTFYVNGSECYTDTLSSGTQLQFTVPGELIADDKKMSLLIDLPDAAKPADSPDTRILALAVTGLQIDETDE